MQLVAVINEDYGEYANLSTRMVNLEGAVVRMQKPLTELQVRAPPRPQRLSGLLQCCTQAAQCGLRNYSHSPPCCGPVE